MGRDEGMSELLKQLLAEGRECEWLEFKENNSNPEDIGHQISALSNSSLLCGRPCGFLVFGVSDGTLEIAGTNFSFTKTRVHGQEIKNWLAVNLSPRIDFSAFEFTHEGKAIVIIRVDSAPNIPVAFKGVESVRVGSYKKKLKNHPEKERKIWAKRQQHFEQEIALGDVRADTVLDLLDYAKYFELLKIPLPDNKTVILKRLEEEGLIRRMAEDMFAIMNVGAVLLGKDLRKFDRLARKTLRVVIYEGKGRTAAIKEKEIVAGYAAGFNELVQQINELLPVKEEIHNGLREVVREYPEVAVRELTANQLIHQDFDMQGTGPMIEMFASRVEFTNPGKSLIEPLRVIDHSPESRNEKLAAFMRRVNICEERGSGIDKVVMAVEQQQLPPPEFVREEKFFKAVLYAPKPLKKMTKKEKIMGCYQHCCLKHVEKAAMTNQSLRERFKIDQANYSIASRIISDTIDDELIKPSDAFGKSKKMASYLPFWA